MNSPKILINHLSQIMHFSPCQLREETSKLFTLSLLLLVLHVDQNLMFLINLSKLFSD